MAFSSSSSCFFTSPNFSLNQHSAKPHTTSRISAASSTAASTSSRVSTSSSLYEVLGIQVGADTLEVKAAYRKLARVLHPDVVGNHDSSPDDFMKLHSAYATLSDPGKRADYDRSLFGRRNKVSSSTVGGYSGRRWETDQCW